MLDFSMFGDSEGGRTPYWMSLKKMDNQEFRTLMMLLMDASQTDDIQLSPDCMCLSGDGVNSATQVIQCIGSLIYSGHLTLSVTPPEVLEARWQRDKEENEEYLKEHPEYGCADCNPHFETGAEV